MKMFTDWKLRFKKIMFIKTELGDLINISNVNIFTISGNYALRYPVEQQINETQKVCMGNPVMGFAGESVMNNYKPKDKKYGLEFNQVTFQITKVYETEKEVEQALEEFQKLISKHGKNHNPELARAWCKSMLKSILPSHSDDDLEEILRSNYDMPSPFLEL